LLRENMAQDADVGVEFLTDVDDLPPGDYVIFYIRDPRKGYGYYHLGSGETGTLVTIPSTWLISTVGTVGDQLLFTLTDTEYGFNYYIIDPNEQKVVDLGPACDEYHDLSQGGTWVTSICTPPNETEDGNVVLEVVSTDGREAMKLLLPSEKGIDANNQFLDWGLDDKYLIVNAGPDHEICTIGIEESAMQCSQRLGNGSAYLVSPNGTWFIYFGPLTGGRTAVLPSECLFSVAACEPIAILEDPIGACWFDCGSFDVAWSPDERYLAVVSINMNKRTTVGYIDTETWEPHLFGKFNARYGGPYWCPDSSCFVMVSGEEGGYDMLVNLDGRIKQLPIRHTGFVTEIK